ncbi:ABC transporter ATP-binding protein [Rhodococcus sp. OK302]|uniref:ABC transporter ATP-binding protein n=1 Tax=Rhodococcus sp. OK302 TaxID=1882769 RepID=UPI000B93F5FD|nr:ABC transporter ATP-binding protein [Rhodococcus sp. OK302]OYD67756.1 iron complex transport system ATP-binding protein [Rhodococcus sp. OK302]
MSESAVTLLEALDVSVCYGENRVVNNVSLTVGSNEVVTLIGPNGSGKSTVMKALSGQLSPRTGVVRLEGSDMSSWSLRRRARAIGMLNQKNTAPTDMTVRELVGYGRHPHHRWYQRPTEEDSEAVDWALAHTELKKLADRLVSQLSGGEAQRAWLAMVLAQRPQVLLLDEPTTYLDIAHQHEVLEVVTSLNRTLGIAVLMVLHDLNQASTFSDRIVALSAGQVVSEGTPGEVLTPDLIRDVYGMEAEVEEHPLTARPRIHLVRRQWNVAEPAIPMYTPEEN